jgi:cytidine deaminase
MPKSATVPVLSTSDYQPSDAQIVADKVKMEINDEVLLKCAIEATKKARQVVATRQARYWQLMGYVGAALVTDQGNVYTGINISLICGIGFCAEHSAVAEMIKNGETKISKIVAVTAEGNVLPPCGRCREMIYQIDESNSDTVVMIGNGDKQPLRELLPHNWQNYFDKSL